MVSTSAVTGDAFQVSLLKSNQKVTAKAKKVNALNLSFTVPAERRLEGTKDVYLSLVHESGRSPARPLPLATITLPSGNLMIPVDAMQSVTFNGTKQQINFRFHPDGRTQAGYLPGVSLYERGLSGIGSGSVTGQLLVFLGKRS